jgi:hypothetical protein
MGCGGRMINSDEWLEFERSCYLWAMLSELAGDQKHRQHFIDHAKMCKERAMEAERKEMWHESPR